MAGGLQPQREGSLAPGLVHPQRLFPPQARGPLVNQALQRLRYVRSDQGVKVSLWVTVFPLEQEDIGPAQPGAQDLSAEAQRTLGYCPL